MARNTYPPADLSVPEVKGTHWECAFCHETGWDSAAYAGHQMLHDHLNSYKAKVAARR